VAANTIDGRSKEGVRSPVNTPTGSCGVGVRGHAQALELGARPVVQIVRLGHVVPEHLPLLLAEIDQGRATETLFRDQGEHRTPDRILQVRGDRLDVFLSPRFDGMHDHEPAAALSPEQAQRVAGCNRIGSARGVGRQLLDCLGIEARAEPAERAQVLRPVAAHEEIDRQQRLGRHRGQA